MWSEKVLQGHTQISLKSYNVDTDTCETLAEERERVIVVDGAVNAESMYIVKEVETKQQLHTYA